MHLRSGLKYLYTASPASTRTRKRKAADDELDVRPVRRQNSTAVTQGEPSGSSHPVSPQPSSAHSVSPQSSSAYPVASSLPTSSGPVSSAAASSAPVSPAPVSPAPVSSAPVSSTTASPGPTSPAAAFLASVSPAAASPRSSSPAPMVIGGEFQLLHVLSKSESGKSTIHLAKSLKDNSLVVIKELAKPVPDGASDLDGVSNPDAASDSNSDSTPDSVKRTRLLQLEIDLQESINHENIVSLLRVVKNEKFFYMVMEYCDQGDLYHFVSDDPQAKYTDLYESIAKKMFTEILNGVEHLHANSIFHRDLKPENIFRKSEGEHNIVCKFGDFGLSTSRRYSMEFRCGSEYYMAPEHLDESKHNHPYDAAASDVWSLGITLLAIMFSGTSLWVKASDEDDIFRAFKQDSSVLKDLYPDLSAATCRLLQLMLSINGDDRPSVSRVKEQFMEIDHLYSDGKYDYYIRKDSCAEPVSAVDFESEANDRTSDQANL